METNIFISSMFYNMFFSFSKLKITKFYTDFNEFESGATIRVQPTSLSRRNPNITRGCRRIAVGRIAEYNRKSIIYV